MGRPGWSALAREAGAPAARAGAAEERTSTRPEVPGLPPRERERFSDMWASYSRSGGSRHTSGGGRHRSGLVPAATAQVLLQAGRPQRCLSGSTLSLAED